MLALFVTGVSCFSLLILLVDRAVGSDDYAFITQIKPHATALDWVLHRYETWSGRIFAEFFVYVFTSLPLYLWKIVSIVMYALFSFMLFAYYVLFAKKRSHQTDYLMLFYTLSLPFVINTPMLTEGVFWVTGAMNYFWITTIALVAFYPVAFYVARGHRPGWLITAIGLLGAMVAASSQEQVGIVLLTLTLIATFACGGLYMKRIRHTIPLYPILFSLVTVGAFFVGFLSPGNDARLHHEMINRLPDFYTLPFIEHLVYAYRWILDSIINQYGALLLVLIVLLIGLFVRKSITNKLDAADVFTLLIITSMGLLISVKSHEMVSFWFQFYPTWRASFSTLSYIPLLLWSFALLILALAPYTLYRQNRTGVFLSLLILAAYSSTAIITFSPTMYASGMRTLYVPSILILIAVYVLLYKAISKKWTITGISTLAVIILALLQYVYIAKFLGMK